MSAQTPLETRGFGPNPEPRCPCLLLLDVSGSMRGSPIDELNAGLRSFRDELVADALAARRVEVACVTFGPVRVALEFESAGIFEPPWLQTHSGTPTGAAILKGMEMVAQRTAAYRAGGLAFYRPWIFLITASRPTDDWKPAAERIRGAEASKEFAFFAVGVEGADMEVLSRISVRQPLKLRGLQFRELFRWLSHSMCSVSRSTPGAEVPLQSPQGPGGWASR